MIHQHILRLACIVGAIGAATSFDAGAEPPIESRRVDALEHELRATRAEVEVLRQQVDFLLSQIQARSIGGEQLASERAPTHTHFAALPAAEQAEAASIETTYGERILVPDLGGDERGAELEPRPELFVQTRYHAAPIEEAAPEHVTRHFGLNRMELRWSGRVADDIGLGFEIQYHPAPAGAPEELVNDAFAEYYVSDALTVRAGQFVKPFGFDIQHSSSARESPERGIFAGYFFPGQRDRGLMVTADLEQLGARWRGTTVYAGLFNGNRFFDDRDDKLNYNLRVRKLFDRVPLAVGASLQAGNQLLPGETSGTDRENLYGFDLQFVAGRLGLRAEYVRGNMPSTLLGLEPEAAPAFEPGAKSSGAALFFNYQLSARDDVYWRYDRFDNDPVTGNDVRAANVGYLRQLTRNSRLGVDYQTKNAVTFNDDELNTQLAITWNVSY